MESNSRIVRTVSFREGPAVHTLWYKVTGSNSVNVFLGLGLAWLIGTVRELSEIKRILVWRVVESKSFAKWKRGKFTNVM